MLRRTVPATVPELADEERTLMLNMPPVGTRSVYARNSPAAVHPTLNPLPSGSVEGSMSTPSFRYVHPSLYESLWEAEPTVMPRRKNDSASQNQL